MQRTLCVALACLVASTLAGDGGSCPPTWSYAHQNEWVTSCLSTPFMGMAQSPVSLAPGGTPTLGPLKITYTAFPLSVLNTATNFQVPATPVATNCSLVDSVNNAYTLQQFHFHFPAEHLVYQNPSERSAGEIHFVHTPSNNNGAWGVIAVRIAESANGQANPALDPIIALAKNVQACHTSSVTGQINPNSLLPTSQSYIEYFGGLTSPPCSQQPVNWFVMASPIYASKEQIAALKVIASNARDLQTLPSNWSVQFYNANQTDAKKVKK